jgi:hypothetical protein
MHRVKRAGVLEHCLATVIIGNPEAYKHVSNLPR